MNSLTIDVEDWYHALDIDIARTSWDDCEKRVHIGTLSILDSLDKYNIKGTFFILGSVAKNSPDLVKDISNRGHTIGSHGYEHRLITDMSRNEFVEDTRRAKSIVEDITGIEVNMYRASTWSITDKNLWALEVLEDEGFVLDSSVQPFKTYLSGYSGAPVQPYHPRIGDRTLKILEVPPSVIDIGSLRIPFSGGLYFRVLPVGFVKLGLDWVNRNRDGLIYIHPWEFDNLQPHVANSTFSKFTHYYGIKSNLKKLEKLMSKTEFISLTKWLEDEHPVISLREVIR